MVVEIFKYQKGDAVEAGDVQVVIVARASPQPFWSKNSPRYKIKVGAAGTRWVWEEDIANIVSTNKQLRFSRILDESFARRRDFVLRYNLSYRIKLRVAR